VPMSAGVVRMEGVTDTAGSMAGRFAPSPTGDLHLGNLRTALAAWLSARSQGGRFIVRMEDLDRVTSSPEHERQQLADLEAIGIDWDGDVVRQSDRFSLYDDAVRRLDDLGRVYDCYCTRREIREAASAPHGDLPDGAYPGTCRDLDDGQRRQHTRDGRLPASRLRTNGERFKLIDGLAGGYEGGVDDVVLRRNDGVPAYNLAVVVDDAMQHVTEVVRGDDLLSSTPRQLMLIDLLGLPAPRYVHLPLAVTSEGVRLAKRHGPVTLRQLVDGGLSPRAVRGILAHSLGLAAEGEQPSPKQLIERFDFARIPRAPWVADASIIG
jgi:glutamyl-tRNA synthetase